MPLDPVGARIRSATATDLALLIMLAAIYGSAFSAMKTAVPHTGVFLLLTARVIIGLSVLAPYQLWRGWSWPTSTGQWRLIGLLCAFNLLLPFGLIIWAQSHLEASVMALLMGSGPFFGVILSHLTTTDDRLTWAKVVAVALGFSGVAIVLGWEAVRGLSTESAIERVAQLAALGASACYASSGLMVRRVAGIGANQLASLVLSLGAVILLPLTGLWFLITRGEPAIALAEMPADAWIAMIYLGLIATGLAYILRYRMIRTVGMSYFGLSIYLVPAFGILIAAVVLGETVEPSLLVGLILMLAGLAIARRKPKGAG